MPILAMLNRFVRAILLPPATLSRAGRLFFRPTLQPPLTGARPTGGAPANEAFLHPSVHPRTPFRLSNAPLFEKHFQTPTFNSRPLSLNFRAPFHLTNTTPQSSSNLLKEFKALLEMAGLPRTRFHDLRHTAASIMLNRGVPLIVVSRILGHAKPSITLDIYGHLIPIMHEDIGNQIDEWLTPIPVEMGENLQSVQTAERK